MLQLILKMGDAAHLIPVVAIIIIVVMMLGYFIAESIKMSSYEKRVGAEHIEMLNTLNELHLKDERFVGSVIFECATGYFITISKSGYIGFKIPFDNIESVYHIRDINGFEILKDGYSSTPNIGAAGLGKMFFGDVGAIIGGLGYASQRIGRLTFLFKTNDFSKPLIEIEFLDIALRTTSYTYENTITKMNKICSLLSMLEKEKGLL